MTEPDDTGEFEYRKIFDRRWSPDEEDSSGAAPAGGGFLRKAVGKEPAPARPLVTALGDRIPPDGYNFTKEAELAVNVALATGRPLLVQGEPGCGKSTLAPAVAAIYTWDFLSTTVTSRTRAQDLLWTFDAVRRLRDAQAGPDAVPRKYLENLKNYIRPGVLWEMLAPAEVAQMCGHPLTSPPSPRSVLLVDEIDKAEPDVPNDLLGPLGTLSFEVTDLPGCTVSQQREEPPLVVITTNEERDLPPAFVRRCVVLSLSFPGRNDLVAIAARHFPTGDRALFEVIAMMTEQAREEAETTGTQKPGTAEYLDAIRAVTELELGTDPRSQEWEHMRLITLRKWVKPGRR